jgi:hypothetical protein
VDQAVAADGNKDVSTVGDRVSGELCRRLGICTGNRPYLVPHGRQGSRQLTRERRSAAPS